VTLYNRNIQGYPVLLTLVEVDAEKVRLDPTNPRIGFSIRQLGEDMHNDGACALLLTSQEETEALKRSIVLSGGVQEPIYLRADGRVAEGNRRVVAVRAAREENPGDPRFASLPAWRIPAETPEHVIQDLLNEIHIGSVRGWAPYEKALQMKALMSGGLVEDEVAERYRTTARDVRSHVRAVEFMDTLFFPVTADPSDPEHRSKFSYFLEFVKNRRIIDHSQRMPDLRERFAMWVRDGKIDTGARVRRLPKILDCATATALLDSRGAKAALDHVAKQNPEEDDFYSQLERTRAGLADMTLTELVELAGSPQRKAILEALAVEIARVKQIVANCRHAE
jgi:hypothetical protein